MSETYSNPAPMELLRKTGEVPEIDPKCVTGIQDAFGLTNKGELIPCCWCDTSKVRNNPAYQRLLAVSKIADYDSIEEIVLQDEWIEFQNNLKNNVGFEVCYTICKKRDTPQHKAEIYIDTKSGKSRGKHT